MPEWGPGYLEALDECRGRALDAAKAMNMSHSTVYKARQNYPELDKAYHDIKTLWDDIVLEALEAKSIDEAMNKSVVERIFHQKARNPNKYRDRPVAQIGNLTITFGFDVTPIDKNGKKLAYGPEEVESAEIPADVEILDTPPTNRKRRRPREDILSEEDLDI